MISSVRMRRTLAALAFCTSLVLVGCTDGGEIEFPDGLAGVVTPDGATAADGGGDGGSAAAGPYTCAVPGATGCSCTVSNDCQAGLTCVRGAMSGVCTASCVGTCPAGWRCARDVTGGPLLCLPTDRMLGAPCREHTECLESGALCLDAGAEGRFCGRACDPERPCPSGYRCEAVAGSAQALSQCVPVTPTGYRCTLRAVTRGATTDCFAQSPHGQCGGTRGCATGALTPCDARLPSAEVCNGEDDDCDEQVDEDFDLGGTCAGGAGACAGTGRKVCGDSGLAECLVGTPGGTERCNGVDDDCDGETDEGFDVGGPCGAGEGACRVEGQKVCGADGTSVRCGAVAGAPGVERCNDLDDDCDGATDEGCDNDRDGWCDAQLETDGTPAVCPNGGGDCNDDATVINPGATELCITIDDDDCDNSNNDEGADGCTVYFADADSDGSGAGEGRCLCQPEAPFRQVNSGDCDDDDALRSPLFVERCDTAFDDDCDGETDAVDAALCTAWLRDVDGDDAGVDGNEQCTCGPLGEHTATTGGDCDDGDGDVGPGVTEACDGVDNDCDGVTDQITRPCANGCGSETCVGGAWQACDSEPCVGPCCQEDGCGVLGADVRCGDAPIATELRCSGACGGNVQRFESWAFCDGATGACDDANARWVAGDVAETCGGGNLCTVGGDGAASCSACEFGCAAGACSGEPITGVVCVDPGFGGAEPGPVSGELLAKDINLGIALQLEGLLAADSVDATGGGRWAVVMTRDADVAVTVEDRIAACNVDPADRVIAIYVNAGGGQGAESYYAHGVPPLTIEYCTAVQEEIVAALGVNDRGTHQGTAFDPDDDYGILQRTVGNACMILPEFIDNAAAAEDLADPAWQQRAAVAMLRAIQRSFGLTPYVP